MKTLVDGNSKSYPQLMGRSSQREKLADFGLEDCYNDLVVFADHAV